MAGSFRADTASPPTFSQNKILLVRLEAAKRRDRRQTCCAVTPSHPQTLLGVLLQKAFFVCFTPGAEFTCVFVPTNALNSAYFNIPSFLARPGGTNTYLWGHSSSTLTFSSRRPSIHTSWKIGNRRDTTRLTEQSSVFRGGQKRFYKQSTPCTMRISSNTNSNSCSRSRSRSRRRGRGRNGSRGRNTNRTSGRRTSRTSSIDGGSNSKKYPI